MKNWQYFPSKDKPLLNKYQRWREISKLLKLSSTAKLRLEWFIFYYTRANRNASLVCRHFGIARKTFYKWFNLFDEKNLRTLEDKSKSPLSKRKPEYTPEEIQKIIGLRLKYPTLGRDKLEIVYLEEYGHLIKKCPSQNYRQGANKNQDNRPNRPSYVAFQKMERPAYLFGPRNRRSA